MDVCEHVEHTRWTDRFCDVIPAGGGKPAGIAAACARWGLAPEECAAFGDGGNDVPMFGCVGTSVAMGNASENVKAAATMVTSDIDDGGLLLACQRLGLVPYSSCRSQNINDASDDTSALTIRTIR